MGINLDQVDMEIITHPSQAGPGFEPMADRYPKEHSKIQERVKRGIIEKKITPKRLACTTKGLRKGMVYVNVVEAEAWLSSDYYRGEGPRKKRRRRPMGSSRIEAVIKGTADGEPVRFISLGTAKILEAVRELTKQLAGIREALEVVATRPETSRHTPFATHLHASTNGDT